MTCINEKAYAKINISLDITGKRPDGYHDMLMVMQTITLCDDITVTLTPAAPRAISDSCPAMSATSPCVRQMFSLPRPG